MMNAIDNTVNCPQCGVVYSEQLFVRISDIFSNHGRACSTNLSCLDDPSGSVCIYCSGCDEFLI